LINSGTRSSRKNIANEAAKKDKQASEKPRGLSAKSNTRALKDEIHSKTQHRLVKPSHIDLKRRSALGGHEPLKQRKIAGVDRRDEKMAESHIRCENEQSEHCTSDARVYQHTLVVWFH